MNEGLVISVSGIRGVVGEALTPDIVARFAAAHGAARRRATGGDTIVIGRDARVSGPVLQSAAMAGLSSVGCRIIDVGLAATPSILLAVEHHEAAGGIAVTASHNPAEWNALKLASERGMFLTPAEGAEVVAMIEEDEIPYAAWDRMGVRLEDDAATRRHVDVILEDDLVDPSAVDGRSFDVVLDACAGVGALAAMPVLEAMGVEVTGIGLEPTGRFPRDPEPVARNLAELSARVRESEADLGLAIDPDGDRLALVDEDGVPIGEDLTLALCVDYVLGSGCAGPVVTNLSTSQVVDRAAEAHNAEVIRAPVGEVNVAIAMRERGSPIGGEGNGGVIYPPVHYTRDAPVAIALVLSHLATNRLTLAEAAAQFPAYAIEKAKLPIGEVDAEEMFDRASGVFDAPEVDRTDGLRFAWPAEEAWVQLRMSGTEPVIRVIAEAPEAAQAESLVSRAREVVGSG